MFKFLLLVFFLIISPFGLAVQVIVHPSVEIDQLTPAQLRAVFSMRQTQWPDGHSVRVFVLASDHPVHLQFCKEHLRMFPYQLDSIWNRLSFSGIGTRPQQVTSEQEMQRMIQMTPGSIGYRLTSSEQAGVTIIEIN